MKILFIDQTAKLSGGELALLDIAEPYKESCKVILFEEGPLCRELENRQINFSTIKPQTSLNNIRRSSRIPLSGIYALIKLAKVIAYEARDFDFIFANSQKAALVSVLAAQLAHKPVVWYLHDILTPTHFGRAQLLAAKYTTQRASQILVNSKATKHALQELTGRSENIHLIYNAFSSKSFSNSADPSVAQDLRKSLHLDNRPLVGLFGRLTPWKGQDVFIKALATMPHVQGIIVGGPLFGEESYAKSLAQDIQSLSLGDRIKLVGFREDIPNLMNACDIVAHTSVAPEPFGRVIVEGMLAGKPVVATETGGPKEIIDNGVTGILYKPGDAHALQSALADLLDCPQKAASMAQRGRECALKRFSLEKMHERLDDIIHVTLKPHTQTQLRPSV